MAEFSTYAEDKIIKHMLADTSWTMPTSVEVAIYEDTPSQDDDDSGTEVSAGNYARQTVAAWTFSGGQAQNTNAITFPTATVAWGIVDWVGIYDQLNNLLCWSQLDASKDVGIGDTFEFAALALTINVD